MAKRDTTVRPRSLPFPKVYPATGTRTFCRVTWRRNTTGSVPMAYRLLVVVKEKSWSTDD